MLKLNNVIRAAVALLCGEDGQGLMEYSLILILISVAAIAMMTPLGAQISSLFNEVVGKV